VNVAVAVVPSASVATTDFCPGRPARCRPGIAPLQENVPSFATIDEQSTVLARLGLFRPDT
jgi:hypothetical protein